MISNTVIVSVSSLFSLFFDIFQLL